MDQCGVPNPETGKPCTRPSSPHPFHFDGEDMWDNAAFVKPSRKLTGTEKSDAEEAVDKIADQIPPEEKPPKRQKRPVNANHVTLHGDPHATEVAAAQRAFPASGTSRRAVYDAIAEAWPGGLTEEEQCQHTGLLPNTVRPRRKELHEDDRIYPDIAECRVNARGNDEMVWKLTQFGAEEQGKLLRNFA